jgi:hypothetical protein
MSCKFSYTAVYRQHSRHFKCWARKALLGSLVPCARNISHISPRSSTAMGHGSGRRTQQTQWHGQPQRQNVVSTAEAIVYSNSQKQNRHQHMQLHTHAAPAECHLFSFYLSSCSWRVRSALHYKNIDFQYHGVDLLRDGVGDHLTNEFAQLNPMQEVSLFWLACLDVLFICLSTKL